MSSNDKIITFESYYDPMLAHIIRSRLEANGIPCFIADENMNAANPLYNQATGGVKIKIFERDLERCREIMATQGDLHEQDHYEIDDDSHTYVVCPYCASTNVRNISETREEGEWSGLLSSISNLINPFHTAKNWHCFNCQQDFE
ncbi:MAG TPA: DUF2007 domain-containing protein [Mucilaginibacter sp.]|jgi:hypothetical protein